MAVARGRYKVFLGMAAGVGKTYRMLQEGQAEAEAGRDVVIGYLEPHGRADTVAQAAGLETVPRRRVPYRDTTLEEMDLPGVLARRPELCLIDELAHTNAPGVEHAKRFQDIADVLAAGIDVYSTVNVQHLESLNDQVAELTGTRVRETVPDAVLASADDVVLIDITPESLRRAPAGRQGLSGRAGPERAEQLLQAREPVGPARGLAAPGRRGDRGQAAAGRARARTPGPARIASSASPPRRRSASDCWRWSPPSRAPSASCAAPGARRSGSAPSSTCSGWPTTSRAREERDQLDALRRLTSVLGAHLLVEPGDDVAAVTQRIARERGTTYVLMGAPEPRGPLRRLTAPALPFRLHEHCCRASTCGSSPIAPGATG